MSEELVMDLALGLFYTGGMAFVLGVAAFVADWLDRRFGP